jgi:8-oxo-dGTP pyrophosphatase MutT (NUDIX family)
MLITLRKIKKALEKTSNSTQESLYKAAGWSLKIKGKPGYHLVADVVDTGWGSQNLYILGDGTRVSYGDVEDITFGSSQKSLNPIDSAKSVETNAILKKEADPTDAKINKIKEMHRDKAEPSLSQKISHIKKLYGKRPEVSFENKIAAIKQKYGRALWKSTAISLPHASVVAVLHNGRILMGRRNDTAKYVFPGGGSNPGENPEQTARRELYEEAGIAPKLLSYVGKKAVRGGSGKPMLVHLFTCEHDHGLATTKIDPDKEVSNWESIPLIDGSVPQDIERDLHIPPSNNIVLMLLRGSAK